MASQQVELQRADVRVRDGDVRKLPETRLDAVRERALRDDLLEGATARVDALCGGRGEPHELPFAGLGFGPAESSLRFPGLFAGLPHAADTRSFQGNLGGTQVHLHLRKDTVLELRVAFLPRLSFRRASKFISRLGVRGLEGTWT